MRDDDFEWDDDKARSNIAKHNVSFQIALAAFQDPAGVEEDDPDRTEPRFKRLCAFAGVVYAVIYTERGTRVRIISARKASTHEQRTYIRQ